MNKEDNKFISDVTGDAGMKAQSEVSANAKGKGLPALFKALTGIGAEVSLDGHADVEAKKRLLRPF